MSELPLNDIFPEITASAPPPSRDAYMAACENRWYGPALADARSNWKTWSGLPVLLEKAMVTYRGQSMGLSEFIWDLQARIQPDKSRLDPFIDLEERHQKWFLCRGLIIYCKLLLEYLEGRDDVSRLITNGQEVLAVMKIEDSES